MSDLSFKPHKKFEVEDTLRAAAFFIHGFTGDREATWALDKDDNRTFWPTWLGDVFPNLQIVSVGYESPAVGDPLSIENKADLLLTDLSIWVNDHDKPYVFLCHSLGGNIVKRMILMAEQRDYKKVLERLHGVIFFATPHQGSKQAKMVNDWVPAVFVRNKVLRDLIHNSSYLYFLNSQYRTLMEKHPELDVQHVDYCESKKTFGIMRIVDEASSKLFSEEERENYKSSTLGYNHIEICKFKHSDREIDRRFEDVVERLSVAFAGTDVLDDQKVHDFVVPNSVTKPSKSHLTVGFIGALFGMAFLPLAYLFVYTMNSLDEEPIRGLIKEHQILFFILTLSWIGFGALITAIFARRHVIWNIGFGMVIVLSFIFVIQLIQGG